MTDPGREPRLAPRVGVFGGTFDPVHVAHLRVAEELAEALDLERLIFVPSAEPPHKAERRDDPIAPAAQRLAWLRAATAENPRFEVDPLEIERGGTSYSVETLLTIGEQVAPELPVFLIGHDAFALMDTWREPATIFTLAHFAVATRPPVAPGRLLESLPECVRQDFLLAPDGLSGRHRRAGTWLRLLQISALDISASDIRARLREGRSVRYLLPEAVWSEVMASGAYTRR